MTSSRLRALITMNIIWALGLVLPLQGTSERTRPSAGCFVLDVQLVTADSMVVSASTPQCGSARVVVTGAPRRIPPPHGSYNMMRRFEIPVAIENAGSTSLALPLSIRVDSAAPLQRGRQLDALQIRNLVEFDFWDGRETQQPWRFTAKTAGRSVLAPDERTGVRLLKVTTHPLTHGFRIWLRLEGSRPSDPRYPAPEPPGQDIHDSVLEPSVERFIAAANFPSLRTKAVVYRDVRLDLLIFSVRYGSPQDCPAGCFYSGAMGLQYGRKIGWLDIHDYDDNSTVVTHVQETMFRISDQDNYLLSPQFTDTLTLRFGRHSVLVDQVLLPKILEHPNLARSRLLHYAEGLYSDVDQAMATQLVALPRVRRDADLLTLLANLPQSHYVTAREAARTHLRQLAPVLVRDTTVSARTLFVLAQSFRATLTDSAFVTALVQHPKVHNNPATLAVLAPLRPQLIPLVLRSVRAPAAAKRLLASYLVPFQAGRDTTVGWTLLADPEAGANPDVLAVLANGVIGQDQEVIWSASRRLPEDALKSYEYPSIPLH